MTSSPKRIAVIGSGPMGLMCGYELLKKGHSVDIFERDNRIGGMSASFDFGGLKIERYYHFICGGDYPLLDLLKELGIENRLRWRDTRMGFYYDGTLYPWGDPIALLRFPKLDIVSKIRYAAHVMYCKHIKDWRPLDRQDGIRWLKQWVGEKAYAILWDSLLRLKYHELTDHISAAWIGGRIQRLAKSRKSVFTESLAYLENGSDTLLDAMRARIESLGGRIHTGAPVREVIVANGKVTGVMVGDRLAPYDAAVSTVPLPYVPDMVPSLPEDMLKKIRAIRNVGVACVILKLKKPLSAHFWLNINDREIGVPGIVEYSNLYPQSPSIVYFPYYMPGSHPKFRYTNEQFLEEIKSCLRKIRPDFSPDWILDAHVSRYQYAQTVCTPGFFDALPPMTGGIAGFYMADTSYYYPEDRSISESVRVGKILAELAG